MKEENTTEAETGESTESGIQQRNVFSLELLRIPLC